MTYSVISASESSHIVPITFPQLLEPDEYPYRRLISWRLREFAFRNARDLRNISKGILSNLVTIADLSESEERSRQDGEVSISQQRR